MHFQDRGAYGRIVHLQPVKWVDDWPLMGINQDAQGTGEPVLTYPKPNVDKTYPVQIPQTSDEFDASGLGLQWQWQANPKDGWMSLSARPGWLRLNAVPWPAGATNHWLAPNFLLQKFPARQFTVTTKLDVSRLAPGEQSGPHSHGHGLHIFGGGKNGNGLPAGAGGLPQREHPRPGG